MSFQPSNHTHYAGLGQEPNLGSLERASVGAQTILLHYPPHSSSYGNPVAAAAISGATALIGMGAGIAGGIAGNKAEQKLIAQQQAAADAMNATNLQLAETQGKFAALQSQANMQIAMAVVGGVVVLGIMGMGVYFAMNKDRV